MGIQTSGGIGRWPLRIRRMTSSAGVSPG